MGRTYVYHSHISPQKLARGEIVELEFSLWPGGMIFDLGESMSLQIMGRHPIVPEFEGLGKKVVNHNIGRHRLYTGVKYGSQLRVGLGKESESKS